MSCSITFFENRAVYEIVWKNILERGMPQMTTWCMRIAFWITKATNTHTYCFSTTTMAARTRLNVTYKYTVCLVEYVAVKNLLQGWDHDNHLATNSTEVIGIYRDSMVQYI
jgi:hypothetical protein